MKIEILILIAFFAMFYGVVYLLVRLKERLTLIQKGANATIFDSSKQPSSLKLGLVLVGLGVGILLGKILSMNTYLDEELAIFSMVLLFGGIGLVIYHLIAKKLEG
ncbi:MAG: hypothetical protein NT004_04775 [Bacteroidetes bacterium]|nr:hypothetical protein [Bacteroidota bacterium]